MPHSLPYSLDLSHAVQLGMVDALVARVAGSTWLLLIVTTSGLFGVRRNKRDRRGRVAREPLVPGWILGSACDTVKRLSYLPCLQVETTVVLTSWHV
jgi:hypothetical protein